MAGQPFECIVSADLFARAMVAVSTSEARYYLRGVHVEPAPDGGALLVATDGRRLIALHDPSGVVRNGTGIVSLNKTMAKALTAKAWSLPNWLSNRPPNANDVRHLVVKGERSAIVALGPGYDPDAVLALADTPSAAVGAFQWVGSLIDGQYPEWRRVLAEPDNSAAHVPAFDLALAAPLAKALVDQGLKGVRLVPTKGVSEGPIYLFPAEGRGQCFGVVMTVRGYHTPPAVHVPAWAERPPQDQAA
jgi:hypothetical protein